MNPVSRPKKLHQIAKEPKKKKKVSGETSFSKKLGKSKVSSFEVNQIKKAASKTEIETRPTIENLIISAGKEIISKGKKRKIIEK